MNTYNRLLASLLKRYTVGASLLALISVTLHILSRYVAYDEAIGYHESGALLPILFTVSLAMAVLLAGSAFFLFRRTKVDEKTADFTASLHRAEFFLSALAGALTLFATLMRASRYFEERRLFAETGDYGFFFADRFTLPTIAAGVALAVFFLYNSQKEQRGKPFHLFCGFASLLYHFFALASLYFDLYTTMNNVTKNLLLFSAVASMLILLANLRFFVGRISLSAFVSISLFGTVLLAAASASGFFYETPHEGLTEMHRLFALVNLAMLLYTVSRLVAVTSALDESGKVAEAEEDEEFVLEEYQPSEASEESEKAEETEEAQSAEETSDADNVESTSTDSIKETETPNEITETIEETT